LPYRTVSRFAGVVVLCLSVCALFGQEEPADTAPSAKLNMQIDAHGGASVELKIFDRSMPTSLAPTMRQVMGCDFTGL